MHTLSTGYIRRSTECITQVFHTTLEGTQNALQWYVMTITDNWVADYK